MHHLFKTSRLFLVLFSTLTLISCSDSDDDDNNNNDGTGPSGSGMAINADNAANVFARLQLTFFNVYLKGAGTHNGAVSGTVTVTGLPSIGKVAGGTGVQQVTSGLEFDNYSDDSEIWLDGTVDTEIGESESLTTIDLEISGEYKGKMKGAVSSGPEGESGSLEVNGQTIPIQ